MSTRIKLLEAFEGMPRKIISGEALARSLGLTRAGVWKHVQALRGMGIPLESQNRTGYLFQGDADCSLARFKAFPGITPHYALICSSTQMTARRAAEAGVPAGHLWISEIQTSGRGRMARKWESGYGGLWFSLVLRPRLALSEVPPFVLKTARTLAQLLREHCRMPAEVKPPNDVVVMHHGQRRKVAGLLTEMTGEADRVDWVVLGIGLNVNNDLTKSLHSSAVSIKEWTGKAWNRAELLESFLRRFIEYRRKKKL